MRHLAKWHSVGALASALAISAGAAALAPGALGAGALQKCGNTKVSILQEIEPGKTRTFKEPIKDISSQGVSCAAAFKFLKLQYNNKTGTVPQKYKCTIGKFKVPVGYVPEVCARPGAKIEYAAHGG